MADKIIGTHLIQRRPKSTMRILTISSVVISIYMTVVFGNDLKDGMPSYLKFEHSKYIFQLKESHGIGYTRERLRAFGCDHAGIMYSIQEKWVPFKIHPTSGKIRLTKMLNYTEQNQYSFIVQAVANNKNCKNEKALAWVVFNVVQHNKYRPQFNADKYYCRISEETGHVKISPNIKVTDRDSGPAGKIFQVQVRESEEPFVLELEEVSGAVTVKPTADYKFDASRIASYKFSLQAWDNGNPPRNSPPVKIHCIVVPQNHHSPQFTKNMYVGRVKQGEVKSNVLQVEAKDGDAYEDFGKICEYFIRTSDMPFEINNKGVISLPKALGKEAPDTYVFTIMAKDCGGRISEEAAVVNVVVDKDCILGFVEPEKKSVVLKDCDGMVRVTPDIRLNMCGESRQYANFTAQVVMQTKHILKGCDRETYEASGVFRLCNVNKTMDLLPSVYLNQTWMAGILSDDNIVGENVYHFDKKTVVDVPSYIVEYTGEESLTISTWIWMHRKPERQFIIAATDPQRLDRKHFGLYTQGDKLVFVHRQESHAGSEDICPSLFVWKPDIFDTHWHHVLVTVDGCQRAKLYVDSEQVDLISSKRTWPLHGTTMARRLVIGARWLGREQTYVDYFDGYLSGLSVNFGERIDEKAIKCVFECKEQVKIDSPAPSGFQITQNDHKHIKITGQGTPETFENILRSLVYVNTRRCPTNGRRPLQIRTTINNQALPMLNLKIAVSSSDKPTLKLSGGDRKLVELSELQKYGIRIAKKLTVTADKCSKHLDSARIEVNPPLSSKESLVNPGSLLNMLNLRKDNLPEGKGVVIRGLATIDEYMMVLREIVYVHMGLESLHDPSIVVYHKFKITVSNLKNRYVSNVLQTELTTDNSMPQYDMQVVGRPEQENEPGNVEIKKLTPSKSPESFDVMIGVIVAAACIFVLVILVVAVRLHSGKSVYSDVSLKGDETDEDDRPEQDKMNVTMNPLEKFETADDHGESVGTANQKTLEWDDAYIA